MAAILEVKYFNSFWSKKITTGPIPTYTHYSQSTYGSCCYPGPVNVGDAINGLNDFATTHLSMIAKTKSLLYAVLTMQVINISLNYLLIFGNFGFPELGVKGSAIATLVSSMFGAMVF